MNKISNLKKNFLPLIFVCNSQMVLNFTFPPFVKWTSPFNIIVPIIVTIFCTIIYIYLFSFPDQFIEDFDLNEGKKINRMYKILHFWLFHLAFFYVWYKNPFNISTGLHLIYYIHSIIVYLLIFRAGQQTIEIKENLT